jgi:hypothetical protein
MLTLFKFIYFFTLILVGVLVTGEFIASNLGEENKFRKWWRKTIIADYNK